MSRFPRALALPLALIAATPAPAGPVCRFTTECYMDLGCEATDWDLTVDRDAGTIATIAETLEILHVETGDATQIVARGAGSLNLLTIGAATSLFSVQIGAGPAAITYIGECTDR